MSRITPIFYSYLSMWKDTFNIKKSCTIYEYFRAIAVHISICVLIAVCALFDFVASQYEFLYYSILILNCISLIPILSLTLRCVITAQKAKWCPILCLLLCCYLIIALIQFVGYRFLYSITTCHHFHYVDPSKLKTWDSIWPEYFPD